jgi:hypothetical protein
LISPHRAAKNAVTKLQTENQALQSQLRFLQHHLSLCYLQARYANDTKGGNRRMDFRYEELRLLGERRKALITSHSSLIHGSHAKEYRTLLMEHVHLQDQFRQVTAARIVARYRLQKLIIDVTQSYNGAESTTVRRLSSLRRSPLIL